MRGIVAWVVLGLAVLGWTGATQASPNQCPGALPRPNTTFGGVVRIVLDGDTICVSEKPYVKSWIKIRLADFNAPELDRPGGARAQAALEDTVLNKRVVCVSGGRSLDRVMARCTIEKKNIGAFMRDAGIRQSGER